MGRSAIGGRNARLFLLSACLCAAPAPARVGENLFESLPDMEVSRQIWMPSAAPIPFIDALPGFPGDTVSAHPGKPGPAFTASWSADYLNLVRRTGSSSLAHGEIGQNLEVAARTASLMEIRMAATGGRRDMRMGDSTASADLGGPHWHWTGSASFLLTPLLVPAIAIGVDSDGPRERGLAMLAFRGVAGMGMGLDWAVAIGRKNSAHPVRLDLEGYRPMDMPLFLRREFRELALRYRAGPWEAAWGGRWTRLRYPTVQPAGYALADSGKLWRHSAILAYDRVRMGIGWRAALDFQVGKGVHVFRGSTRNGSDLYRFSHQEAAHAAYSIRADLRLVRGLWEAGGYAGGAESEWKAARPEIPFNRHFWNRNGVIDSYEGSILGLFNNETWLFDGAAYAGLWGAGLWGARDFAGWRIRGGLGYQHVVLEAETHLTRRETYLLLSYTEESHDRIHPTVRADVLTPEIRLEKSLGPARLSATLAQAWPARVRLEQTGRGNASGTPGGGKGYSGGTRAGLEIAFSSP